MTHTNATITARLEYLRGQLKAECISYCELADLQSLAQYIDPADVELLEAAGVPEPGSEPAGPFYVVIDHEQTAAECSTLEAARTEGRTLADAEPIPCAFSIQDRNGQHVEDITRTDGRTLADQVQAFDAAHRG